jgi:hypothetical protein
LIEVLLGHRHLPAVAIIEGIRRALQAGSVNPEVVLVEARQAADTDPAQVVPIGMGSQSLARYDRPTPALGSYDVLLASDHTRSSRHRDHEAVGQVAEPAEAGV